MQQPKQLKIKSLNCFNSTRAAVVAGLPGFETAVLAVFRDLRGYFKTSGATTAHIARQVRSKLGPTVATRRVRKACWRLCSLGLIDVLNTPRSMNLKTWRYRT